MTYACWTSSYIKVCLACRHHTVRGPCKKGTMCYRQTSSTACTHNDECPHGSSCIPFDDSGRVCVEVDNGCMSEGLCRECSDERPDKCGESLFAIATRSSALSPSLSTLMHSRTDNGMSVHSACHASCLARNAPLHSHSMLLLNIYGLITKKTARFRIQRTPEADRRRIVLVPLSHA